MQAVVTDPGGPAAGAASPAARRALRATIPDVFLPSRELTGEERIGLYAGMYFQRLIEVLLEEFPALVARLGRERCEEVFRRYVVRHPSRHYSLNVLGARLPLFLRDEAGELAAGAFAVELARLERTIQDVFDAPEHDALEAAELARVPLERWGEARLVPIPAFALLAFEHGVNRWYQSFRDGAEPGEPTGEPSWLAVYRREGRVWRMDLSRAQHAVLGALAGGRNLTEALESLADVPGVALTEIGAEIHGWFRLWSAEGLFARVEIAG
jgi:hypothetical protein